MDGRRFGCIVHMSEAGGGAEGQGRGRSIASAAALGRNAACSWWRKLIGEIAKGGQAL
jgi:hypothetical protein